MRRYPAIIGAEIVLLGLALLGGAHCFAKQTGGVDAVPKQTTQPPPDPQKLFDQAREAQQSGNAELAVREYQELISRYPDMVAAHANLAVALSALGRYDEAIQQYRAALDKAPGDPQLRMNLALTYYRKGDFSNAVDLFAALYKEQQPGNTRIAILLGDCDVRLGRSAEAVSLLTPIRRLDPNDLDVDWVLGSALINTGQLEEGVKAVQKVAEQRHSAAAYLLAAETYLRLTSFDQARRDCDQAIELDPQLPGAYTLSGIIADYQDNYEAAVSAFTTALRANPNDLQAHIYLGAIYYVKRRLEEARAQLDRALQLQPDSFLARYELALVELRQNQPEVAAKDFQTAERQAPNWLPPHVELAALYYRLKRPQDGERERKTVDQLRAQTRQKQTDSRVISPLLPPPQ